MHDEPGGTVYVLGAGASVHAGAPVLMDFVPKARQLFESKRANLVFSESFGKALHWIDRLRASSYYVDVNLDNLEHVFSIAELQAQIGDEEGRETADALGRLICETLDLSCELTYDGETTPAEPTYARFATCIRPAYNADRRAALERDAVISLNYDVLLDHALWFSRRGRDYGFPDPSDPSAGGVPLYKLHGSVNWASCPECKPSVAQILDPSPLPPGSHFTHRAQSGMRVPIRSVTANMKLTKCPICSKPDMLRPLIVPPTWSKQIRGIETLGRVWRAALQALRRASRIVTIGYSLPRTDTFFQYLCALAVKDNHRLEEVIVVNPDATPDFQARYRSVFSRSLHDRGKLRFVPKSFAAFVKEDMKPDEP